MSGANAESVTFAEPIAITESLTQSVAIAVAQPECLTDADTSSGDQ